VAPGRTDGGDRKVVKLLVRHDGSEMPIEVERHDAGYRVRIGERWIYAELVNAGPYIRSMRLEDGTQFALVHHREGSEHHVSFGAATYRIEITDPLAARRKRIDDQTAGGGMIRALMPGRIVRVLVQKGDAVRKGAGLLILEAMKMENEIQAPADGIIDEIFVEPGQTVEGGADLAHLTE